jgi:methyl-accepting chemotaxis protein
MSYEELAKIEQGKYTKRLDFLHLPSTKTSPEEIYLLLDSTKVESAAETQLSRWAHRLEAWRNGLILLPLLLTWLSLGLAALAYIQTYQAHADQPFLKQWADGFPGTSLPFPVLSFIEVAGIDAALILILILLTIAVQIIESYARSQASKIRAWLDDELFNLASSSPVRSLGVGTDNKRPAWAVEVHSAISHLNNALIGVESLVKSSHDTLTNLVNTSQTTFENLVKASQEELKGSVTQFSGAIRDQREAVENFMKGTTEVRGAVDELKKIYEEGERIYQGLNGTLPKLESSFSTMATRQDNVATALEAMSSKTAQATEAVGNIAQQFTHANLVQSTYAAAQCMQQTAGAMHDIALQMGNTVDKQMQLQVHLEQWMFRKPSPPPKKTSWFRQWLG